MASVVPQIPLARQGFGCGHTAANDLNPNTAKPTHALAIDSKNAEPDIRVAMEQAKLYRLDEKAANSMLDEVRDAIADWRTVVEHLRLDDRSGQQPDNLER